MAFLPSDSELKRTVRGNPVFIYLALLTIAVAFGFQSWRTLLNNFMVEQAGLDGSQNGIVQSVREIPGFLALGVVYALLIIREQRLAALAVLFTGLGITLTGFFPSFAGLIFTTVLMSFGFHYFETTGQSMTLQHFPKSSAPWALGKLKSYQAGTNLVVGILILLLAGSIPYSAFFLTLGLPALLVGLWALSRPPLPSAGAPQHKHLLLRRRYWLYYALTFMSGARRQIFVAFAMFLAVQRFGYSLQEVTGLFLLNNLINYFLSPRIGKAIMRFGERPVLVVEYISLFLVFLGYTQAQTKLQLGALYLLDNIFFNFKIAIQTYFQKIADPGDIAPSVAVAFTINHIASVIVPALFGLLWLADYRLPFFCGALMSLVSLLLALRVRLPEDKKGAPKPKDKSPAGELAPEGAD